MERDNEASWIEIYDDLLLQDNASSITSIVEQIYPNRLQNHKDLDYLQNRTILAPKNDHVEEINNYIL